MGSRKQSGNGKRRKRPLSFVDLFSGCGGMSLGLLQAGLRGLFAIEKDEMAFRTFAHNLLGGSVGHGFAWPEWLPREPHDLASVIRRQKGKLIALRGHVDLLAGGPPCQGFSFAGRRKKADARNRLFKLYVEAVRLLRPRVVLVENVPAILIPHGKKRRHLENPRGVGRPLKSYAQRIRDALQKEGYSFCSVTVEASRYGVPQRRLRFVGVGVRTSAVSSEALGRLFDRALERTRVSVLRKKGLNPDRPVTARQAISDLEIRDRRKLILCRDEDSPSGFKEMRYRGPRTAFQKLMHAGLNGQQLNSLRLARHTEEVSLRFQRILRECRLGVRLDDSDRERLELKKHRVVPVHAGMAAHTITTLADDVVHYSEPRILTVRESARLQTFPDNFDFKGKYTTGGAQRCKECPRYTQVGNAVPPLLAEHLALALAALLKRTSGD
jgi:DNA (cytosine-5)-methyltransferase 1